MKILTFARTKKSQNFVKIKILPFEIDFLKKNKNEKFCKFF